MVLTKYLIGLVIESNVETNENQTPVQSVQSFLKSYDYENDEILNFYYKNRHNTSYEEDLDNLDYEYITQKYLETAMIKR